MPDLTPNTPNTPIPDYSHLSRDEEKRICALSSEGYTQTSIAQLIGCSQSTVSTVLADYTDTKFLAARKADNLALKAVLKLEEAMDPAAESGKSGPMEAILKMAKLLGSEDGSGPKVIVQIGVKDSDVTISLGSSA